MKKLRVSMAFGADPEAAANSGFSSRPATRMNGI
jgi:hypothetical protein